MMMAGMAVSGSGEAIQAVLVHVLVLRLSLKVLELTRFLFIKSNMINISVLHSAQSLTLCNQLSPKNLSVPWTFCISRLAYILWQGTD